MPSGIDAELAPIGAGVYDIQIDPAGDIQSKDFFDTAILVSLLGERRATASQVRDPRARRGWIGNLDTGFEIGSHLWQFEQSRLTPEVLRSIEVTAKESLQWLVDDGFALAIKTVSALVTGARLHLVIAIEHPNGEVEKRAYDLWNNTGLKEAPGSHVTLLPFFGRNPNSLRVSSSVWMRTSTKRTLGLGNVWSFATWFSPLSRNVNSAIFIVTPDDGVFSNQIDCRWISSGAVEVKVYDAVGIPRKRYIVTPPYTLDDWYLIGATWDGSTETLRIWVNGVEATVGGPVYLVKQNDIPGLTQSDVQRRIYVGRVLAQANGFGRVYSLAFWPIIMDPIEMVAIYGAGREYDLTRNQVGYQSSKSLARWYRLGLKPDPDIGADFIGPFPLVSAGTNPAGDSDVFPITP